MTQGTPGSQDGPRSPGLEGMKEWGLKSEVDVTQMYKKFRTDENRRNVKP